jgi:transcriptional regulator with XRE-family HTH domain
MGQPIFPTSGLWPNADVKGEKELRLYGERLRDARLKAGLTQVQLADVADIDQSTVSGLEKIDDPDEIAEGSNYTAQFAAATGVEAYWLATGKPPRKRQAGAIDAPWLAAVLAGVDIAAKGRPVTPQKRAEVAAAMYLLAVNSPTKPELSEIVQLLKTML